MSLLQGHQAMRRWTLSNTVAVIVLTAKAQRSQSHQGHTWLMCSSWDGRTWLKWHRGSYNSLTSHSTFQEAHPHFNNMQRAVENPSSLWHLPPSPSEVVLPEIHSPAIHSIASLVPFFTMSSLTNTRIILPPNLSYFFTPFIPQNLKPRTSSKDPTDGVENTRVQSHQAAQEYLTLLLGATTQHTH